jgi:hypothetical protein
MWYSTSSIVCCTSKKKFTLLEIQLQLRQNDVADNKEGVRNNKHLVLGYEKLDTRAVSAGTGTSL